MEFFKENNTNSLVMSYQDMGVGFTKLTLQEFKNELNGKMVITANPMIFDEFKALAEQYDKLKWKISNLSAIVSNTIILSNENLSEFYSNIASSIQESNELNTKISAKLLELQTNVYNHVIGCNTDDGNGNKKWEELI